VAQRPVHFQAATTFGATSPNEPGGKSIARTATSWSISMSIVSSLTLPGTSLIVPSSDGSPSCPYPAYPAFLGAGHDQGHDRLPGSRVESRANLQRQGLLTHAQRGTNHAVDPALGRWLHPLGTASVQ